MHARDLARAIQLVAEHAPIGKVYNAGPVEPISICNVVELVAEAMNIPFDVLCKVSEDRLGQESRYWLDSSAIKRDVGWEPEVTWQEGLDEMIVWARTYFETLKDWPTEYSFRG